ncbi:Na(+)-translocating NADH-quinone reductase subunit A, partial [Frankliniella fusca]
MQGPPLTEGINHDGIVFTHKFVELADNDLAQAVVGARHQDRLAGRRHLQVVVEPERREREGREPEEERPRGHLRDAQRVEDEGQDDGERVRGEHRQQAPVHHVPRQLLRPVQLGALQGEEEEVDRPVVDVDTAIRKHRIRLGSAQLLGSARLGSARLGPTRQVERPSAENPSLASITPSSLHSFVLRTPLVPRKPINEEQYKFHYRYRFEYSQRTHEVLQIKRDLRHSYTIVLECRLGLRGATLSLQLFLNCETNGSTANARVRNISPKRSGVIAIA